ncbi:MAG TPA: PKD domain-containing protein [Flavobacteriales bacterium]|nr:PKD domain-containing protein [Flavobacteriales bacterium]
MNDVLDPWPATAPLPFFPEGELHLMFARVSDTMHGALPAYASVMPIRWLHGAVLCFALFACLVLPGTVAAQCSFTLGGVPATLCGDGTMELMLDTAGGNFGDDNDVVITWSSTAPGTFSCSDCTDPVFTPTAPILATDPAATITASVTSPNCPGPNTQSDTYTLLASPNAGLTASIAGTAMGTSPAYGDDIVTFILCEDPPPASTTVDFTDASSGPPGYSTLITPNGSPLPASGTFPPGLNGGTYTVTDPATGCSSSLEYQVLVGPPVLSISAQLGIGGSQFGCADEPLAFEITPTGQNPFGMVYTIHESYDLGPTIAPVATLTNLPSGTSTFFHAFSINSCGGTHAGGPNTAGLEVTPAYGCYFGPPVTPITTNGVYISNEPVAAINAPERACIGPVVFDNTSQGSSIDNSGACDTNPENGYWTVSGSSPLEWSLAPGLTLGNDNGTPDDPTNWNFGSDPLTIDFHVPGTYSIEFTVGSNSGCGSSTHVERNICIEAPPPPTTFTVSPASGCAPFTPNITNLGPEVFGCEGTYEWSVESDCAATADFDCSDCTAQFDPAITFNGAGIYSITMTAQSACPGVDVVQQVEVFAPPTAAIDPLPAQLCTGQCISPTATLTGCADDADATYAWTFTNAGIASFNGPVPPQVCPVTNGVDLGIALTVTNSCGPSITVQASVPVEDAAEILPVLSDGPVCEGGTITLTASGGDPGAAYTWTDPSGVVSALSTTATIVIANATNAAHNGSWNVSAGAGPCDAVGSIVAVVYAPPVVDVIAEPPGPLCIGNTTTLTASADGAGTYQWTGGPNAAVWADVAPLPPTTSYAVSFTDGSTGCTGQGNIDIEVNNTNMVTADPPVGPACDLSPAVALDGGAPAGGTWTIIDGPGTITGAVNEQAYIPAAGEGPYAATLQYEITTGGCPGSDQVVVNVPAPTAADAGPTLHACDCEGVVVLAPVWPPAGLWTPIPGILDGQGNFNTCASGAGSFTVEYCPGVAGTCTACATTTVVVHGLPGVLPFADLAACDNSGPIALPQPVTTGVWTGDLVSAGAGSYTFDTDAAPLDEVGIVLTYTYTTTDPEITCTNTAPMTVLVHPMPTAAFEVPPGPFCAGTTVPFTDTSTPGAGATIDHWDWDFGDMSSANNTATTANAEHTYASGDSTYTVTLSILQGTCAATTTQEVILQPEPVAAFTVEPSGECAPVLAQFQQSMVGVTEWNWDFDYPNGDTSMEQDPMHVYEGPGAYQVMLAVGNGCASDTLFLPVTAGSSPQLTPTFSPSIACNGTPVAFGLANGPWANVQWTFGDPLSGASNFANDEEAAHLFSGSGSFTVSVVAQDPITFCQGAAELPVTVSDTLTAEFTLTASAGCAPLQVELQSTTAGATDVRWTLYDAGGPVDYFSDAATYTFETSGSFSIRLLAEHGSGCVDSAFTTVEVHPPVSSSFSTAPDLLCGAPADVAFTNTSSGVGPLAYTWSFGVGDDQSIASDPTYTYMAPGDYDVCLAVESEHHCIASQCEQVQVFPPPNAAFHVAEFACAGTAVQFTAPGGADHHQWWFGDGASSMQAAPMHSYDVPGVYDVALAVIGEGGCRDSLFLTDAVVVLTDPVAAFSVDTLVNSAQLPIYDFHDASIGANALHWDFGDGTTSDQSDPRHEFPGTYGANYTTCLTVANEGGCWDTECTTFTYNAGGSIFIPNSFTPNGDQKNDVFFPVINGFEQCKGFDFWIYDRWGNLVEHLKDRNDSWDGTFNGAEPLIDVYVWRLSLSDCLDDTDPADRRGHVTIVLDKSE